MRIAIVHPWFLANGGAEETVNVLAEIFPNADFFTLFYCQQDLPPNLKGRNIKAISWNWLPEKYKLYRHLLPFYPMMFESLDLRGYDVVISSDSCVAKGILVDQGAVHICYCHSPMRCLWDLYWQFRNEFSPLVRPVFTLASHYVRQWDSHAANRVDRFIANSQNVSERISKFYRRDSTVIYPPVEAAHAYITDTHDDYYLSVGRLTSTKRIDILIDACNRLKRRLIVAGSGREDKALQSIAGNTIEFVGRVPSDRLSQLYARCRAVLFAADEDFGIVPVEAQAYGRPVIAYGQGGATESIIPLHTDNWPTGVFFPNQTSESLQQAILEFEEYEDLFSPANIRQNALRFDKSVFSSRFKSLVNDYIEEHRNSTQRRWRTRVTAVPDGVSKYAIG